MRLLFFIGVSLATLAFAGDDKLPANLSLVAFKGEKKLSASEISGKPVLIEFWASWCWGCSMTMPKIAGLAQRNHVRFLPVSLDENMKEGRKFFDRVPASIKKFEPDSYLDEGLVISKALNINPPAVILVGADGRILARADGHPTTEAIEKIEKVLSKLAH